MNSKNSSISQIMDTKASKDAMGFIKTITKAFIVRI